MLYGEPMMQSKIEGAVAVASILLLSGRRLPARMRRRIVLWCGGKGSTPPYGSKCDVPPIVKLLKEMGVDIDARRYTTFVTYTRSDEEIGLRYIRWKIVVKDEDVIETLVRMGRNEEYAKELLRKHVQTFKRVLKTLGRTGETSRVTRLLTKYFTAEELRRILNATPSSKREDAEIRNRAVVRALKLSWREWLYQRVIHAGSTKSNTEYSD